MTSKRTQKLPEVSLPEKAVEFQTEIYTSARKIEFLLNNAVDAADYARAVKEAQKIALGSEEPAANPIDERRNSSQDFCRRSERSA